MKQLLHNELQQAAVALREGRIQPDVFFGRLITLIRDHFENLGLSEAAFRHWSYDPSPELWRKVKAEFSRPGVSEALVKAELWIRSAAKHSGAFRVRFTDKPRHPGAEPLPLFRSIMWRYYYRHIDPPKTPPNDENTAPIFYTPPPDHIGGARPWISERDRRHRR